jgi:uncharacterized membrane protein YcaP (DUF421 family)
MFHWMIGNWRDIGLIALGTLGIYVVVSAAVRFGGQRTLAEMSVFDVAVAVAIGAIVGRSATADSTSLLEGSVAIVTLVAVHRLVGWLRTRWPGSQQVVDPDPTVLVHDGTILSDRLEAARVTERDLRKVLRQQQVRSVADVELLVLEQAGTFSLYLRSDEPIDAYLTSDLDATEPLR